MNKKYLIAKLDEVISSGSTNETDKNKLTEIKKEIQKSTYLSEAISILGSGLLRIFDNDFDLFQ